MCLNGLKCSQNAGKLHSEGTKFQISLGGTPLVNLVQITHVKSWILKVSKKIVMLCR